MNLPLVVLVLLIRLLTPSSCPAELAEDAQPGAVTIGKLQFGIKDQERLLDQSTQEEQALLEQLRQLDEKINSRQKKIDELKGKIRTQEQRIAVKDQELAEVAKKNEALRQHLVKRLKAFYVTGKTGFLNVTFSGKTLPDLVLTQEAFHSLVTYDQALFKAYRESVAAIERVREANQLEKSVLVNFLADADAERAALNQAADEQTALLQRAQMEKGLHAQALKEMRKAEEKLTAALPPASGAPSGPDRGFAQARGKLPPPVWGQVVGRFHAAVGDEDPALSNGVSLKTAERVDVFAVYGGTVIFAGSMRGYGKLVIVEHDRQYHTVTARLGEIAVREGDAVKQGQMIGQTAAAAERGLYFEIRRGAAAEDPLRWLRPGSLAQP
jgi:septal ring factor EnvC (AmiA/AmiB activator)